MGIQDFQGDGNTDPAPDHPSLALMSLGETSVSPGVSGRPFTGRLPWLCAAVYLPSQLTGAVGKQGTGVGTLFGSCCVTLSHWPPPSLRPRG